MGLDLNEEQVVLPQRVIYSPPAVTAQIAAGQTLKLETAPDGEELMAGTVPEGKKWNITNTISIVESNA